MQAISTIFSVRAESVSCGMSMSYIFFRWKRDVPQAHAHPVHAQDPGLHVLGQHRLALLDDLRLKTS